MPTRTITIAIDIDVTTYQDKSGLTDEELAQQVYDLVEEERNELAMEARISALKLMDGETKEFILMERAEDELMITEGN